jgi:hypothetical protein
MIERNNAKGAWIRRCVHCGRRGTRAFEWKAGGGSGWWCTHVDACVDRHNRNTLRGGPEVQRL